LHPAGLCDLQLSLLFFKTTPVLKIFSSEPDGMPLFEAWRLKIITHIQLPRGKHRFLYQFRSFPCPKVCYPFPKISGVPRCQVGKLYAQRTAVMYQVEVFIRSRRAIWGSFIFAVLFAVMQLSAFATGSVTLAWNASTDPSVAGYNVYYGGVSGVYTNEICAGNATNATISGLVGGTTYYFATTTYAASGMESPFSSEVSYLVPMNTPNTPIVNYSNTYTAVVCTNLFQFKTNTLPSGKIIIRSLPPIYTNLVFTGSWIYYPPSGVWTLQSSSNLLTWVNYATGTNAVYVPYTGGNWYFRFRAS
jgi:hypothetical protein